MLVGLWAGEQLGLSRESRAIYPLEVIATGLLETGPEDIVDKISRDFIKRGIDITRGRFSFRSVRNIVWRLLCK